MAWEALRQQRGRNEVKVMVRLPESERRSSFTIEHLILLTEQGGEISLAEAAEIEVGRLIRKSSDAKGVASRRSRPTSTIRSPMPIAS